MSEIESELAIIYFNQKNYVKAAKHYLSSIKQLHQIEPLTDKTYRLLILRYIDLAGACSKRSMRLVGDHAIANALIAFNLIAEKSKFEKEIGDPVKNFQQFLDEHEALVPETEYTNSSTDKKEPGIFTRKQYDELSKLLNSMNIEKKTEATQTLSHIFGLITLQEYTSPFIPISLEQDPEDNDYRKLAQHFIMLSNQYMHKDEIKDAVIAARQTIKGLKLIKAPSHSEKALISSIEQLIDVLREETPTIAQSHARIARIYGLFRSQEEPEPMDLDVYTTENGPEYSNP